MADKKDADETHQEVEIAKHVRTNRDRVFFPGKALVDNRTQDEIDETLQAEADRKAAVEAAIESGTELEEENELGDTRTSTKRTASKRGSRKGGR
jgi:hypothetical protein